MRVSLSYEHRSLLRGHAEAGYPREVCGFLLGSMDAAAGLFFVHEVRPAGNRREDRSTTRNRNDPEDYRAAARQAPEQGREGGGIYHSHPDAPARPSDYDREQAWPNSAYVIVPVEAGTSGDPKAWLLAEDRSGFEELALETAPWARATEEVPSGSLRDDGG